MIDKIEIPEQVGDCGTDANDALHQQFRPGIEQRFDAANESERMGIAEDKLRQLHGLHEEEWKTLDGVGRTAVLQAAGREISNIYEHPAPPLYTENMSERPLRGVYGDGYSSNPETGELEGSDYGIRLNTQGETSSDGYISDDPREALRTYLHEFRHSYQHEQALRWEKVQFRNLVEDEKAAESWSQNFDSYKSPENGFDDYQDQAVEADARNFADELIKRIFG